MCYIFDSLEKNHLLNKDDKIALMTPIFTPYLEIPHLPHYNFDVINIHANEVDENGLPTYQYTEEDLNKLKDTDIKAVFIVNPNNPASVALNDTCMSTLKNIVENHNPNLMIVTDDVYCTFVNNFKSVISYLPYNTIGVYSLSKYFGVTGWRLGAILLNENNIKTDVIGKITNTGKTYLEDESGNIKQLVPKFREAAYTPIKKVIDSINEVDFEENKKTINHATVESIKKKDEIVSWIKSRYE